MTDDPHRWDSHGISVNWLLAFMRRGGSYWLSVTWRIIYESDKRSNRKEEAQHSYSQILHGLEHKGWSGIGHAESILEAAGKP